MKKAKIDLEAMDLDDIREQNLETIEKKLEMLKVHSDSCSDPGGGGKGGGGA